MSTRLRYLFTRLAPLALVGTMASGCANKQAQSAPSRAPDPGYTAQAYATPTREVVYTDPEQFEGVTVTGQQYAQPTEDVPDMVGYETFSTGEQVTVVAGGAAGVTGQSFTITLTNYTRANCIAFMSDYVDRTLEQSGLLSASSDGGAFAFPITVAGINGTCDTGALALEYR